MGVREWKVKIKPVGWEFGHGNTTESSSCSFFSLPPWDYPKDYGKSSKAGKEL